MATRTLAVVSAGLSVPSSTRLLADRLAGATVDGPARARRRRRPCEVVELREHARDLADNLVTGFPNANLRAALDTVVGADGLIAVTPIFSASYSGLFKTFFDVVDKDALERQARTPGRDGRARRGTRWRSSTRCGRCSPTCARSSCRPRCSRRRRTGARATRRTVTWSGASSVPRASSPTSSPVVRRPWRPTRSPPRRRSRRCSAAPDPADVAAAGATVSAV